MSVCSSLTYSRNPKQNFPVSLLQTLRHHVCTLEGKQETQSPVKSKHHLFYFVLFAIASLLKGFRVSTGGHMREIPRLRRIRIFCPESVFCNPDRFGLCGKLAKTLRSLKGLRHRWWIERSSLNMHVEKHSWNKAECISSGNSEGLGKLRTHSAYGRVWLLNSLHAEQSIKICLVQTISH